MATAIDICNLALSLLGEQPSVTSIDPPDGSPQAGNCQRWFPHCLRKVIEDFDWSFLTRRCRLAPLSSYDRELYGWPFGFNIPSDCVRVIKVEGVKHHGRRITLPFEVEQYSANKTRMLLTTIENPILSYVYYDDNVSIWPSYFSQCVVLCLAAYLVGPLRRTDTTSETARSLFSQYETALAHAKRLDAKSSIHDMKHPHIAPQLAARRV